MEFGFTVLTLALFGTAIYFAFRYAQTQFGTQIKALQRNAARKAHNANTRIASLESRLNDAVHVINQLKMSAPTAITTPATPDYRKNMEDRFVAEAQKEARVLGKGNN